MKINIRLVIIEEDNPQDDVNKADNEASGDLVETAQHEENLTELMVECDCYSPAPITGGDDSSHSDNSNARDSNGYGKEREDYGQSDGYKPLPGYYDKQQSPPLQSQEFGPGISSMKNNHFDAMKYLIRCGIPKENLNNLPKKLLKQIGLWYCGLCGLEFNSLNMSRIHYISKNHSKKQKKFIMKLQDGEIHRLKTNNVPLKDRELCCELCDVQMTSKDHAKSHYAGKPHRAVIQGRKPPKNPVLLQKGMEDRLNKLIRREKRALKATKDVKKMQLDKEKMSTTMPEFYCKICNSFMNCMEQMTIHLNTQRHLTKEKQHILKIIKDEKIKSSHNLKWS